MKTKYLPNLFLASPRLNHLNILKEIAFSAHVTQAELAKRCALSVAMINNYMKELCAAGFIEYRRKSVKSVAYYLTAPGMLYLRSLEAGMLDEMSGMYAENKERIRALVVNRTHESIRSVVIYGCGDLAQLVFHALYSTGIKILGICDDNIETIGSDFCGRQVFSASQIRFFAPDAVIVAELERADDIIRSLASLPDEGINVIRLDESPELYQGGKHNRADALTAAGNIDSDDSGTATRFRNVI
jgi:predicted transcriptional regulator